MSSSCSILTSCFSSLCCFSKTSKQQPRLEIDENVDQTAREIFSSLGSYDITEQEIDPPSSCSSAEAQRYRIQLRPTPRRVLDKWRVDLPAAAFTYCANTDDFGVEIEELFFRKSCIDTPTSMYYFQPGLPNSSGLERGLKAKEILDSLGENMKPLAKRLGVRLVFSDQRYWVRDQLLRLPRSCAVVSPLGDFSALQALERTQSLFLASLATARYCSSHPFFDSYMGAGLGLVELAYPDLKEKFGGVQKLPFYMEGGNHYFVSNSKGAQKLLMGEEYLPFLFNQLQILDSFSADLIEKLAEEIEKNLTEEEICKALQAMHAQGLLDFTFQGAKGLISYQEMNWIFSLGKEKRTEAIRFGFQEPLEIPKEWIAKSKKLVACYLAKLQATKDAIASTLQVKPEDLVFIPQAAYHLDVFLKPGPSGSVFIQNYALCKEILETIKERSQELTSSDVEMLNRYIATAELMHKELGPLLAKAEAQLKMAEFIPIPTPGLFFDSPSLEIDKMLNINFLNAISGWSSKTKSFYYIAAGASAGDRLGKILMDVYREFLSSYVKGIEVHFVGYEPANPTDFRSGMQWLTLAGAGPHCFSLETKTKSRTQ